MSKNHNEWGFVMEVAVRYFSKLGNTKAIAEEIAVGAGVQAVSVVDEPELPERVDVLYLGGAPYANIMAPELREYAERLTPDKVGRVVLFSTSNWSRRVVLALRKILKAKGIPVTSSHFWAHMTQIGPSKARARMFGEASPGAGDTATADRQAIVAEAISSVVIVSALVALGIVVAKRVKA